MFGGIVIFCTVTPGGGPNLHAKDAVPASIAEGEVPKHIPLTYQMGPTLLFTTLLALTVNRQVKFFQLPQTTESSSDVLQTASLGYQQN